MAKKLSKIYKTVAKMICQTLWKGEEIERLLILLKDGAVELERASRLSPYPVTEIAHSLFVKPRRTIKMIETGTTKPECPASRTKLISYLSYLLKEAYNPLHIEAGTDITYPQPLDPGNLLAGEKITS